MKLIDKDALVQYLTGMAESACCDKNVERIIRKFIIPHINSLEVKEVDLEKEYKDFVEENPVYNKLANGIVGKAAELAKKYCEGSSFEDACMERPAYIAGYHQAEKRLGT